MILWSVYLCRRELTGSIETSVVTSTLPYLTLSLLLLLSRGLRQVATGRDCAIGDNEIMIRYQKIISIFSDDHRPDFAIVFFFVLVIWDLVIVYR